MAYDMAYNCRRKLKSDLSRRYNISVAVYEALMEGCDRRCMICRRTEEECGTTLCIDHDHDTGKIKGVCCDFCNRGLGMFRDNPELLRRAAEYIEDNLV